MQAESVQKPSVLDHTDYRDFLGQYYAWRKSRDPKFSYRYFARHSKLRSYTYLKYVIDKRKHISHKFISNFIDGLKLSGKEARHFKLLWEYQLERNALRKREIYLELTRAKRDSDLYLIEAAKLEYIQDWLYVALREYFSLDLGVRDAPDGSAAGAHGPKALAEAFGQPLPRIRKALAKLLKLGLIEQTPSGYRSTHRSIKVDDDLASGLVLEAHRKMLKEALRRIDGLAQSERELGYLVVGADSSQLPRLKSRIRSFLIDVNQEAESMTARDRVYLLAVQLMPLSGRKS